MKYVHHEDQSFSAMFHLHSHTSLVRELQMLKHVALCEAANMTLYNSSEGTRDNNSQICFTARVSHKISAENFTTQQVTESLT